MYVNRFFRTSYTNSGTQIVDPNYSILSIPAKEDALLSYARDNHITYLVFYDMSRIFGNPVYESYLCSFLEKAKTQYCIEKLGIASSCASMFENVAGISPTPEMELPDEENAVFQKSFSFINDARNPQSPEFLRAEVAKMNLRMTSFNDDCDYKFDVLVTEFEFWNSGTDNCTDETLTRDQKYENYQQMITDMDLIRDNY